MHEPVDGGDRHAGVREHIIPAGERLVSRGYQKAFSLVPLGDQFEQHAGFGLVLARVRQINKDDEVEAIELRESGWPFQALARGLQLLDEFSSASVPA